MTLEASNNDVEKLTYVYESTRTIITPALGLPTIHEFTNVNGARRLAKIIDAEGKETVLDYDANLNLIRREDPKANVTTYAYDAFGNVTNVTTLADNGATDTLYDGPFRQPSLITDPNRVPTSFGYNAQNGDLTSVTTPDGPTTMLHDPFGHVTNSDPPGVPATTFGYDSSNGALNLVTDPLGRPTQLIRDSLSRVKMNIDPKGKRTDFTYDDDGNLLTVKEYIAGRTLTTTYEYVPGRTGKLLGAVIDAKGQRTEFQYDALGRLQYVSNEEDRLLGKRKEFTYDAKSRLRTSRDPNGNLITFGYDDLDRLTRKARPDGDVTYGYDANGNLTSVEKSPDSALGMTYDGRDRLETVLQTVGGAQYSLRYGYDRNGNRTSLQTPWGTLTYTYDSMNRLDTLTVPASLGAPSRTFDFDYDAAGRRTALKYPNGTEAVYAYDEASQLRELRHKLQGSTETLALAQYDYDLAGNRTQMTDLTGTHFYGYDELHRATAAVHPNASSLEIKHEVFTYDDVGNRLADARATGYAYDRANRLLSDSLHTYENDFNGNRTAKIVRATGDRTDYIYDSENQLIQVTNSTGTFSYKYDGLGRRIEKSSGPAASQTVKYVYDNEDILAMLDGANNLIAVFGHGPGIDEPLMIRHADGTEYFMHADGLGSVVGHSSLSGDLAEILEFEVYGFVVFRDPRDSLFFDSRESLAKSPYAYAGLVTDAAMELAHTQRREIALGSGIFLQEDILRDGNKFSYADSVGKPLTGDVEHGSTSQYHYAYNNPLNFTDPLGLDPDPRRLARPSKRPAFCEVDPSSSQDACILNCTRNRFGTAALAGGLLLEGLAFFGADYTVWRSYDIIRGTTLGIRIAPGVVPAVAGSFLFGFTAGTAASCAVECTYARQASAK